MKKLNRALILGLGISLMVGVNSGFASSMSVEEKLLNGKFLMENVGVQEDVFIQASKEEIYLGFAQMILSLATCPESSIVITLDSPEMGRIDGRMQSVVSESCKITFKFVIAGINHGGYSIIIRDVVCIEDGEEVWNKKNAQKVACQYLDFFKERLVAFLK